MFKRIVNSIRCCLVKNKINNNKKRGNIMKNINKLIGNTPMIKIKTKFNNKIVNVYAKLEYYNYTGSIKDRLANYIILESKKKNLLKENQPIIEATSGNTGISFSALGALYNHPVHIFMPDWVSLERVKIMKQYGAIVHLVSKEEGGFLEAIRRADLLSKEINGFRPDQFSNYQNVLAHYNSTGKEIVKQIKNIDAFITGIGTGGTLMGIAKRLKENNPKVSIFAMEPKNMTLLSKNKKIGSHKIEGVGDEFIPEIVDKNLIEKVITISDEDALNMTKLLSKELGLGVGISSGANFLASLLTGKKNVVTIFADDIKKYLSTDLVLDNDYKTSYDIEILDVETI